MAATPIDICVDVRTPARITGQARGSRTRHSEASSLMPMPRDDSSRVGVDPLQADHGVAQDRQDGVEGDGHEAR